MATNTRIQVHSHQLKHLTLNIESSHKIKDTKRWDANLFGYSKVLPTINLIKITKQQQKQAFKGLGRPINLSWFHVTLLTYMIDQSVKFELSLHMLPVMHSCSTQYIWLMHLFQFLVKSRALDFFCKSL